MKTQSTKQLKNSLLSQLTQMRLSVKLPLAIAGFSLICGGAVAIYSQGQLRASYEKAAQTEMSLTMQAKSDVFAEFLDSLVDDVLALAGNPFVISSLAEFTQSWNELDENQTKYLQNIYINQNPNPSGKKSLLDNATDKSQYSRVHAKYHPYLSDILQ